MTVIRWILGVCSAILGAGSLLALLIYIIADIDIWIKRARKWRRLMSAFLLFWFNLEIWRRVVLIIIHW